MSRLSLLGREFKIITHCGTEGGKLVYQEWKLETIRFGRQCDSVAEESDNFANDCSMDVGQTSIDTVVTKGQLGVIQAELM